MNKFTAYEKQYSYIQIRINSEKPKYPLREFLTDINLILGELKVLSKNGFSKIGIVRQLQRVQELIDRFLVKLNKETE